MTHFLSALAKVDRRLPAINGADELSFGRLWRDLEEEARALMAAGVGPRGVVAVDLPGSSRAITVLLAIWRVGATYLPLGQDWPADRKDFVLRDANAKLVIGADWRASAREEAPLPSIDSLTTDLPSHLIYTSGSTGAPKGVLVSHRGLVPVLRAQIEELGLAPGKRSLLLLSLAFDASLSDIGTSLLSGATLVIPKADRLSLLRDPDLLAQTLRAERITHVDLPPSIVMKMANAPPLVEHVILGGESCAHESLVRWSQRGVKLTIAYGPTEATICTSMHRFDPRDEAQQQAPIGRPLPHVKYRIDPQTSELLIGGECLAIGYQNRPDLTRERFVDGWFKTGDRVSEREDGSFIFLGRIDRQFKSRGVLIAPEEIEAALTAIPEIVRAAVTPDQDEIVAFIESKSLVDDIAIRRQLLTHLPASMIPHRIIRQDAIPTTTTGKPNFTSLVTVGDHDIDTLRGLFASVLRLEPQAIHDDADFFLLGGDSFAVLDLVAAARARGMVLAPADVFEHRQLDRIAHMGEMTFGQLRSEVEARIVPPSKPPPPRRSLKRDVQSRHVLLTGATGFLGARVLRHLLERTDIHRIYCLIRGERSRVATNDDSRVIVIDNADLSVPQFGLAPSLLNELAGTVTDIFHLGAAVDMVRPYSLLAKTNLDGTISILQFAEAAGARLHYASTLSVFVHTDRSTGVHREHDDLSAFADGIRVYGGYAQTKVAAEIAVRRSPVSATIHRFGLLTSGADPFAPPRGCQLDRFLRELGEARTLPAKIDRQRLCVDITPIDFAARAMIHLALSSHTDATFHIASPKPLSLQDIVDHLAERVGPIHTGPLTDEKKSVLALSLLRHTSTDLFLATDCDFDLARTTKLLRDGAGLVCPDPTSILKAHLQPRTRT